MFNVVVFASGGGGNFQSLIDRQSDYGYTVSLLVVDRNCGAVDKAIAAQIPYVVFDDKRGDLLFRSIDAVLPNNTDLIVCAGFMSIIPAWFCEKWKWKIINTHPSLLPKYGGKGMYGVRVQKAVMAAKEKYAGCTVHFVNEKIDGGDIIAQTKIEIDYTLTPWELGGKVFNEEVKLLPKVVKMFVQGDIKIND